MPKRIVTFFPTYNQRLTALAEYHRIEPEKLKTLIEDAYGVCQSHEAEQESAQAIRRLAKLNVTNRQINWLNQLQ